MGGPRYQASPFIPSIVATPSTPFTGPKITSATLSTCAPDLIRGCSQFVVEYAGNFYTKNVAGGAASGALYNGIVNPNTIANPASTTANPLPPISAPVPDPTGQLDFYIDANGAQHTRWYGYPRSVTGNAIGSQVWPNYPASNSNPLQPNTVSALSGDVVPLRDVLASLGWATVPTALSAPSVTGNFADAERFSGDSNVGSYQGGNTPFPSAGSNYWTAMTPSARELSSSSRYTYTAAWGPDVHYMPFPKMVRIIIEVDDHEGRLNAPQRYEFVYDVQQ
jgi:hypothetical protein